MKRRKFIQNTSLSGIGLVAGAAAIGCKEESEKTSTDVVKDKEASLPVVIATWNVHAATSRAWEVLQEGRSALDAVEAGQDLQKRVFAACSNSLLELPANR